MPTRRTFLQGFFASILAALAGKELLSEPDTWPDGEWRMIYGTGTPIEPKIYASTISIEGKQPSITQATLGDLLNQVYDKGAIKELQNLESPFLSTIEGAESFEIASWGT